MSRKKFIIIFNTWAIFRGSEIQGSEVHRFRFKGSEVQGSGFRGSQVQGSIDS